MQSLRIISYGGGVQSTALCVLATQGKIGHIDAAVFSNVGDDSEHPATIRYIHDVMIPWCRDHGLELHEVERKKKTGETETLWQNLTRRDIKWESIPVRMPDRAPARRTCTDRWKIVPIAQWLRKHGATKDNPATVCIGFSTDEAHRASNKRSNPTERSDYPLLDLRLSRSDCKSIIAKAGLPVPPKSACFFCPFHRPVYWSRMRRDEPELFEKSAALEKQFNDRRSAVGKPLVYLTRFGLPLEEVIEERQPDLEGLTAPDTDSCDDGYCWT